MGMVIPQHQQTNQLSTTHFATTSSSETAGNGEFNSAGNQSQNNQNFINLESGLGQVQQMSSFVDRSGGNVHIQDHNINMQHINSFALSQSQGSNMPNLFAPHLLQNQTQLLSVHNQFRQDNVNDWRNALSFQDRNHVVRQLYDSLSIFNFVAVLLYRMHFHPLIKMPQRLKTWQKASSNIYMKVLNQE